MTMQRPRDRSDSADRSNADEREAADPLLSALRLVGRASGIAI
jgi:hypothetical protein